MASAGAAEGHALTKTQRGLAPSASTHSTSACTSCMLTLAAGFEGCTDARACAEDIGSAHSKHLRRASRLPTLAELV